MPDNWLDVLQAAVAADPRGITGVAERIGYSRTAVSLALAGRYGGNPERIAHAVVSMLQAVECPFLGHAIPPGVCRRFSTRSYISITAADVPHWRACRKCSHAAATKNEAQS